MEAVSLKRLPLLIRTPREVYYQMLSHFMSQTFTFQNNLSTGENSWSQISQPRLRGDFWPECSLVVAEVIKSCKKVSTGYLIQDTPSEINTNDPLKPQIIKGSLQTSQGVPIADLLSLPQQVLVIYPIPVKTERSTRRESDSKPSSMHLSDP